MRHSKTFQHTESRDIARSLAGMFGSLPGSGRAMTLDKHQGSGSLPLQGTLVRISANQQWVRGPVFEELGENVVRAAAGPGLIFL